MLRMNQSLLRICLLGAWVASTSAAHPQQTTLVSVATGGAQGDRDSKYLSISADRRFIAFSSAASNLVAGDTNDTEDVFVRDLQSGTTVLVSAATGGAQGDASSILPSISADGRYVAFISGASNFAAGDMEGDWDVFVHDRHSGRTELASIATDGTHQIFGTDDPASISADGRYVSFMSWDTNLVAGDTNGAFDVFVHDCRSGTTERVSVATSGAEGDGGSYDPSISADGRYVAFHSGATNFVAGDTNNFWDIFVHDRQSGETERVSVSTGGAQANNTCHDSSISADGRHVAFRSAATNLVGAGDTNASWDIFAHDRQSGTTERVSVSAGGVQANSDSEHPSISTDGRFVAFTSAASNLVAGDTNGTRDVFVRDCEIATTERVSVDSAGVQGNNESFSASLPVGGRYVAFASHASNLVSGDTNGRADVFLRDLLGVIGTQYCTASINSTGSPAEIVARGSASIADRYLELESSPVPDQPGIFFNGQSQTQVPFGNGFRCVSSDIVRGAVTQPTGSVATYLYDNSAAKHSLAAFVGTTRNFQHWFHDPAAGGAFFNTSNAVSIPIAP